MTAARKSSAGRRRVVHFTVEGEWLTETARNLFVSDCPAKAWRLLKHGLLSDDEGAVDVAARQILDGKQKLIGDSTVGLQLVDDNADAYIRLAHQIYAGRVRIRGAWFRPAARVVLDAASARAASRIVSRYAELSENVMLGDQGDDALALLRLWWKARLEWGNAGGQIAIKVARPGIEQPVFVLFEPVSERPFWWDELSSVEEAYEDYHRHHNRPLDTMEVTAEDFGGHEFEEDEEARENSETSALRTAAKLAQEEIDAEAEDARYCATIAELRMRILAQANGDLIDLIIPGDDLSEEEVELREVWSRPVHREERVVQIPRAPFMHWALSRGVRGTAPDWTPISPRGMKCQGDNPYHTDWMIGAGLDLRGDYYHESPAGKAAWSLAYKVATSMNDHNAMVLSRGNDVAVTGIVGQDVLVLANLHPSQADAVMKARAVVTEMGGALAHLAIISRESGIPLLLVKDACKAFPPGTKLLVDPRGYVIDLSTDPLA